MDTGKIFIYEKKYLIVISFISFQDNVSEEERTKTPKDLIRTLAQLVSKSCFNHGNFLEKYI